MRYHVELNIGQHMGKSVLASNTKWEVSHQLPYHLQPPQLRYQLQRYLQYAYGRTMAKAITTYVHDYQRQGFDVYMLDGNGANGPKFSAKVIRFFNLYIYLV